MPAFHDRRGDALTPSAPPFLRQINKGTSRAFNFVKCNIKVRQEPFGEASTDPPGEQEAVGTLVTDKQSAEVFAAAFGRGVAADDELLLLGQLDFDPGTAAPAGLVERIRSFGDQAFQLKLPSNLE
jgi:hypothetical protein